MKILLIGFLVFSGWTSLSTYLFVCKIKGLCDQPIAIQMNVEEPKIAISSDTLSGQIMQDQAVPDSISIYFAFDKFEFNANALTARQLDESRTYIDQHSSSILQITGHTDSIGTEAYNQALGYRRAQCMLRYFESKGLLADRITIISKGENEPSDNNNTLAGRANNRSAVITVKK